MTSILDLIANKSKKMELRVVLTGKEIQLMRNVLSDVQTDPVGLGLNLKISNAILDALIALDGEVPEGSS